MQDIVLPVANKVIKGKSAEFECNFNKSVIWTFDGDYLPINAHVKGNKITIDKINFDNEGDYICETNEKYYYRKRFGLGKLIVKGQNNWPGELFSLKQLHIAQTASQ